MKTLIIACEVLRPELELLARDMPDAPPMEFLEQRLHDFPEKLRAGVQERVTAFEQENEGPLSIIMGYGLCGRGLAGVYATRATLIFPRLHDCIPLLLGVGQTEANCTVSSREGATYWITPGWLKYFLIDFHVSDKRFRMYAEKFGEARAARMVKAENALLSTYKGTCHIRWPEMGDEYLEDAKKVAQAVELPYTEVEGASGYMLELLQGGKDLNKFMHLAPGQTIDMDVTGTICAVDCSVCAQA